ncbi:hypothetical protein [Williamsia deligens]|uniref:Mce-associated membrane protein n=1 Tax=Williamsia deligens TaxID=321325 RepID=A0ABW3G1V1_9NOCA|nr:hypothetical protein [Williamsia deligens]MCP2194580.1 Mce-associated membrane protein [Williamsia deligens]
MNTPDPTDPAREPETPDDRTTDQPSPEDSVTTPDDPAAPTQESAAQESATQPDAARSDATRPDATGTDPAEPSDPAGTSSEPGEPSAARRLLSSAALPVAGVIVVAGLIAAIVFAGIYGYRWYDDAMNKEPVQTARDDALGGAEQAMLNILNIDLKDSDAYQKRLQGSVTGNAASQLLGSTGLGQLQKQAGDPANAATLTAKLQRSAVVELDTDEKSAKTLVFLNVTSARPNQASSSQTMGFQVGVTKDGGVWKANLIQPLDSVAIDSSDPAQSGGAAASTAPSAAAPSSAAPAPGGN